MLQSLYLCLTYSFLLCMSEKRPLISIITVTYQAAQTLDQAIQSVVVQEPVYELIVIDGGSTDDTVSIIQKWENSISYWVSEPDKGIYDAMNKGVRQASGCWIYFLGADDQLAPGILATLQPTLLASSAVLLYGDVQYDYGKYFRSAFGPKTYLHNTIHHQATFYRNTLFDQFSYDASLKIIADYELNLIVYLNKLPHQYLNQVVAICAGGGSSYDVQLSLHETNQVRGKHVKGVVNLLLNQLLAAKYFVSYVLLRKV
ncbi:glycosyltransferase family 2 protein [Fibrella sp. WM1]|uniref:glycosyltransferase family 2 protein n=1 Tax=Fibrella musci TaxID=3242485 RepID=UPI003522A405